MAGRSSFTVLISAGSHELGGSRKGSTEGKERGEGEWSSQQSSASGHARLTAKQWHRRERPLCPGDALCLRSLGGTNRSGATTTTRRLGPRKPNRMGWLFPLYTEIPITSGIGSHKRPSKGLAEQAQQGVALVDTVGLSQWPASLPPPGLVGGGNGFALLRRTRGNGARDARGLVNASNVGVRELAREPSCTDRGAESALCDSGLQLLGRRRLHVLEGLQGPATAPKGSNAAIP